MNTVSTLREAGQESDLSLMRLVAGRDARAQRVLAHRLAGRVQRISHRLLRDSADAEDAAQLSLMEILRSAGGYKDISSVERWADRITVRTVLRHAREQRKRHGIFSFGGDPETSAVAPNHSRIADETPRTVEDYLNELPAARREVLVLKHAMGHTTQEIAELTGKPVGTVKDRLVAARRQLRKIIQRDMSLGAPMARGSHD